MQKKPIRTDTFTFENLISSGGLYVDKTQYFYELITSVSNCYFCSRPRRFGKSLAISIFKNIFLGKKDLFEGLYIAGTDYNWEEFPVIHIDMARIGATSDDDLFISLMGCIKRHAREYGVEVKDKTPWLCFDSLISALREKTGKNVVILIDECDRPLTENIDNPKTLEKIRVVLDSFYQIIKGQEPNERFVFMTGVTRFSKASIFSKLNNLTDITMNNNYACMFGYTQAELEENFAPYIDEYVQAESLDKAEFIAKIKKWYNGYKFHWKAEPVCNPVSVGQFFNNGCRFSNYWFTTATPTFIANLAKNQSLTFDDIENAKISDSSMNVFDILPFAQGKVTKPKLIQLLLQTGYLTIEKKFDFEELSVFKLRFPNFEVQNSFENVLFEVYSGMDYEEALSYVADILEAAYEIEPERMIELFRNFFNQIPHTAQTEEEKYCQTIIFCILKMCRITLATESGKNKNCIDAILNTPHAVYIFEFKINQNADEPFEPILQKDFFQKFIDDAKLSGKKICCMEIDFSSEKRNIAESRYEFV